MTSAAQSKPIVPIARYDPPSFRWPGDHRGTHVYKPHTHTYRWAAGEVGAPIGNCMIIAAHGWDVAGATLAGMRTAFLARPGKTLYPLGPDIEISGRDMGAVADQLVAMPK